MYSTSPLSVKLEELLCIVYIQLLYGRLVEKCYIIAQAAYEFDPESKYYTKTERTVFSQSNGVTKRSSFNGRGKCGLVSEMKNNAELVEGFIEMY